MITDIHCHYVPDQFFKFARSRPEFAITIKRQEGDAVDLDIRGMHFGLNTTFFEMEKQVERMQRDGVDRAMLSLATPFIDYHLDAALAVEAAAVFNDGLAAAIAPDRTRFGGWALLPMQDPEAAARRIAPLCPRSRFHRRSYRLERPRSLSERQPVCADLPGSGRSRRSLVRASRPTPWARTGRANMNSRSWRAICSTAPSTS